MQKDLKQAIELVIKFGGSTSLLQRKMRIGYTHANRLMNEMEDLGVVGENQNPKPRVVLIQDISEIKK